MAEYYYNLKKYKEASRYYLKVVKFNKDKWYTRHLYNLAWSLMSINKTRYAIKYIKKTLVLSMEGKKTGQYVDYSDNVLDSFPYFVDEKNLKKSVELFEKILLVDSGKALIKAAENSQSLENTNWQIIF